MNFGTLQTFVFQQTGLDSTDTNNATNVQMWINIIQQDIAGRWPWNFLKSREVVQTVIDKTAGTVAISSGSTTVTGTSTSFVSGDVGKFIQFQGANDWYKVTAYGSATSLTIEAAYAPTANLTGGTYTLRQMFYSLSSSADRILDIRNWNTPLKLYETDPRMLDSSDPNPSSSSNTYAFVAYGYDSSGNLQISPYPYPSDVRNLEVRTLKRLTDMSSSTDTPVIPAKWHHVLAYGATYLAFAFMRKDNEARFWNSEYEKKIGDMMIQARTSEDDAPVLKAIDSTLRTRFLQLPSQFPAVTN